MQPETESLAERIAKLEHALVVCAWGVDTYGPHYAALFEALEHQLNRARNTASVVERAKRMLRASVAATTSPSVAAAMNAPALTLAIMRVSASRGADRVS